VGKASAISQLQSVQNAAARLITGTRCMEHITPVLQSLYWLPVRQRILFKVAVLVHKCLNGRAPSYLADDCRWIRHRRVGLRSSSDMMKLDVPPTRTTFGDRSFAVNGPRIWNSLYRRQFTTHHCHALFFVTASRLICSSNSCGVCDSEWTPDKYSKGALHQRGSNLIRVQS